MDGSESAMDTKVRVQGEVVLMAVDPAVECG